MSRELERGTALLAAVFGASLLTAIGGTEQQFAGTLDARRSREIAILARVLEKRLGDVRKSMADAVGEGTPAVAFGGPSKKGVGYDD